MGGINTTFTEETLVRLQVRGCMLICTLPEDKTFQFLLPLRCSKEPYSCVIQGRERECEIPKFDPRHTEFSY